MAKDSEPGCGCRANAIGRRAVVLGVAGAAVGLSVGRVFAVDSPETMPPQIGDILVRATGKDKTTPLLHTDIEVGGFPIQAWPADPATGLARDGTFYNVLLLSAWNVDDLSENLREHSGDGVLANTVICPHASCEVSDYDTATGIAECPCHFSRFNLKDGGALVSGPATRKLPSIGLGVDDTGRLVIASGFDSRVGGDAE